MRANRIPLDKRRSGLKVEEKRQFSMSATPTTSATSPDPTSSVDDAATTSSSDTSTSTPPPDTSTSTTESSSTPPPTTTPSSSSSETPTSSSESTTSTPTPTSTPSTSSTPTSTPSSTPSSSEPSSSNTPTPSTTPSTSSPTSTPFTSTTTSPDNASTETITSTSFATQTSGSVTSTATSTTGVPGLNTGEGGSSSSLGQSGKIAVAVVVPIAGVALIVLAGLFFWRRRKQRRDAEEERRKEVEDYSYNPNNDPTLPNIGGAGAYEMKEDASSGYRGWGSTTLAGSTGRKGSTTMSGAGGAFPDEISTVRGNFSDTRSGEPLMSDGSRSPEGEILGAMGPSSADNRGANVHRGPSNASSSYSAAGRSDGSGENVAYGSAGYYDQYGTSNPYSDPYSDAPNGPVQPVIRDNPARRNTRIENPSHYPQQSAGISQNF
ncbi:hypothetical protein GQX73_g3140 [Xylaria multiplex]|uniref:REJ domain-containing protein n=1 Tax=Xylaria multiplex TaxID=323545 RepID=A0A7C8MPK3_9PEZI|nr:hypothetical protein GQX73_g3140 [Xylaria multiplex]